VIRRRPCTRAWTLVRLCSTRREEDHVADRGRIRQEHHQPIDPDPKATRRWHALVDRIEKFVVQLLFLFATSMRLLELFDLEALAGRIRAALRS
jgi:hypothetical protein